MKPCSRLLVVLAVLNGSTAGASAPVCAPTPNAQASPSVAGGAWRIEPTTATGEAVRIDCTEAGCVVVRELAISNPTDVIYEGLVLDPLKVWIDGVPANALLITDLVSGERFGPLIRKLCEGLDDQRCLLGMGHDAGTAPPYAYATPVRVEPGRTARIVERGGPLQFTFPPVPENIDSGCPGSVDPAPIHTRHLLLGSWRERRPRTGTAVLAANGPVTITFPSGWAISMPGQGPRTKAPDGSGRSVLTATARTSIAIDRTLPAASWIRRGGPFIAAGGSGTRDAMRFSLRGGYEVAHRGWLIYSAAVETNFERVTVAPVVEAALPTSWHVHWAIGAGIPLELAERRDIGGRLQVTLHALGLGLVATADYFPASDATAFGLYGQLSL